MADSMAGGAPAAVYAERCARFGALREQYNARASRTSAFSVVLFLAALACFGLGFWHWPFFIAAGVLLVGFVANFVYQGRLEAQRERYAHLWQRNDEGLRRLRREWANLPLRQPSARPPSTSPATDLDLAGHASLLHLLAAPSSPGGLLLLQQWLLHPATPPEARARQDAVRELAPEIDFRDELAVGAHRLGAMTQPNYEAFLRWAESSPWLAPQRGLIWASRALPLATLALIVLQVVGIIPFPLWLLSIAASVFVGESAGGKAKDILDEVAERQTAFEEYGTLFALIATRERRSPLLRDLYARLTAGMLRADEQMRRLSRILRFGELRRSTLLVPLQWATLLNLHVLWLLEGWQRTAGSSARHWLEALTEVEALAALATLAYDHPTWTFPDLLDTSDDTPSRLIAANLGHPLLPPAVCVGNDVSLGPPGTFLLVTGSNMSGKSTLLRAIGVNVALAQAGGPVCAASLRLSPVTLATSMRIADSLEYGVSYFLAELQRLKDVVDQARATRAEGGRTLLFLLDEILHGTNTSERQIAARRILRTLLALGAMGAVSTHDLALAGAVEFAETATLVHFTEHFTRSSDGPAMSFDYRLRPGLATSTNALKLMEIVGLPADDEAVDAP